MRGGRESGLVYSHNWYTDPMGLIPQTLASEDEFAPEARFFMGAGSVVWNSLSLVSPRGISGDDRR